MIVLLIFGLPTGKKMLLVVDVMLCFLSYVIALIFPSLSFLTKSKLYFMNHYCILPAILPTICVHS